MANGMIGERRDRPGVDVRRWAQLERNALVAHVRRERAELGGRAVADRHVLEEPHAVPDPVRPAVLQRLPDRRRAERLAGVDGDGEVLAAAEEEGLEMDLGRMAGLLAGDVEANDTPLAVRDRELGHLERVGTVAHGADDLAEGDTVIALRLREAA